MKKRTATPHQLRQRELAWLLFVLEGADANVAHAAAVNCVTFTEADMSQVHKARDSIAKACGYVRRALASIK